MSGRAQKQFFYGVLYLIVFIILAAFVYVGYIRPLPGCQNGRQDAGEEGVDCGGVCDTTCVPQDTRRIEVIGEPRVFRSTSNSLEVLVKIQNANTELSVRSFDYKFTIFGDGGEVVDTISGKSFVHAGEVKYISAIKARAQYRASFAEFAVENIDWIKSENWKRPSVSGVQERTIDVTASTLRVGGRVTNRDLLTLPQVVVTAVFYDTRGIPVGISETEISDMLPEESRPFAVIHPAIDEVDAGRTEIFVSATRQ